MICNWGSCQTHVCCSQQKSWKKIYCMQHMLRINKAKCTIIFFSIKKSDLVQSFCSESRPVLIINSIPSNPKGINLFWGAGIGIILVSYQNMINSDNSCIPIRMIIMLILWCQHHDIRASLRIHCVLFTMCCTTSTCAPNFSFLLDTVTRCYATTTFTCCSSSCTFLLFKDGIPVESAQAAAHLLCICQAIHCPHGHMLSATKTPRFMGIWLA